MQGLLAGIGCYEYFIRKNMIKYVSLELFIGNPIYGLEPNVMHKNMDF